MIYNEIEPFAAQWLENLIAAGHLPAGRVDRRSISELKGSDCDDTTHFFAGIGGWPLALRLAGWPDDLPVWTGSCPCQPFSAAGLGRGVADGRHLWPEMFRLINERRPSVIFGEQVASKAGLGWLDGVFADLEGAGYTCGAADMPAAGVGAPHIRQRLFWVAVSDTFRHDRRQTAWRRHAEDAEQTETDYRRGRMADANGGDTGSGQLRLQPERGSGDGAATEQERADDRLVRNGIVYTGIVLNGSEVTYPVNGGLEHSASDGRDARRAESERGSVAARCEFGGLAFAESPTGQPDAGAIRDLVEAWSADRLASLGENGLFAPWEACDVIPCLDGKSRRIGRGVQPLAHGIPRDVGSIIERLGELGVSATDAKRLVREARSNRIGRLRGYGNAIVPQVAAVFIRSVMDYLNI